MSDKTAANAIVLTKAERQTKAQQEAQAKKALSEAEAAEKRKAELLNRQEVEARISVYKYRITLRSKQLDALAKEIQHQKDRLVAEEARLKLMP